MYVKIGNDPEHAQIHSQNVGCKIFRVEKYARYENKWQQREVLITRVFLKVLSSKCNIWSRFLPLQKWVSSRHPHRCDLGGKGVARTCRDSIMRSFVKFPPWITSYVYICMRSCREGNVSFYNNIRNNAKATKCFTILTGCCHSVIN